MPSQGEKPGLQAERTQLSWERTAISFLVAGALPLLGRGPLDDGRIALPVAGALLAVLVVWLGRRRAHRFTVAPKAEILLLGCATAGFAGLILMVGVLE
jgi:hypothetical protein